MQEFGCLLGVCADRREGARGEQCRKVLPQAGEEAGARTGGVKARAGRQAKEEAGEEVAPVHAERPHHRVPAEIGRARGF